MGNKENIDPTVAKYLEHIQEKNSSQSKTISESNGGGIKHWTDLGDAAKQIKEMADGSIGKNLKPKLNTLARSLALAANQQQEFLNGLISNLESVQRMSAKTPTPANVSQEIQAIIRELEKYKTK